MADSKILPLLLACFAASVGGAGLVLLLQPEAPLASPPSDDDAAMLVELEDMRASFAIQQARLDVLTEQVSGLGLQRTETDAPSREDLDQLLARFEELDRTNPIFLDQPTEQGLSGAIENVLEQREAVARQEKEERWERKQQQQLAKEVERLTRKLALTPVQAQDLTAMFEQRAEGRANIRESILSGEISKRDSGEPWAALETEFDSGLAMLLTPVQLEDYRTLGEGKGGAGRQQGRSRKQ